MEQIKIESDGFAWLVISKETAEFIFKNNLQKVYLLYDDESNGLCESIEEIRKANCDLGVELGFCHSTAFERLGVNTTIKRLNI